MAQANETGRDWPRFFEEIGKVGSQHAAHALSALLRVPVSVNTLRVQRVNPLEMVAASAVTGEAFFGVYFTIYGERAGSVLVMISRDHACRVVDLLRKQRQGSTKVLDEHAFSIVRETANILTGAYLGAIRTLVTTPLIHSIPYLAMDQWDTIINSLLPSLMESGDQVVLVEAELVAESVDVRCYLIVVAGDWAA